MLTPSPSLPFKQKLLHHVRPGFGDTQISCFHAVGGREVGHRGGVYKSTVMQTHRACTEHTLRLKERAKNTLPSKQDNSLTEPETDRMAAEPVTRGDLSEEIKVATKDSHVRSESTEMMMSFQKGVLTLPQYKLLMSSLYEIYKTLEEALDKNSDHPAVAPIHFPAELARLEALRKDLEFLLGKDFREKIVIPAATRRYCHRLRQIGDESPELLVSHSYTRYLGDLSGGQYLIRWARKCLDLQDEGLSFFVFPGVTNINKFKQLYRSRMNMLELTEEQRKAVLDEAVNAFELNIQVFGELTEMLRISEKQQQNSSVNSKTDSAMFRIPGTVISSSPLVRMMAGLFLALATVTMGVYLY